MEQWKTGDFSQSIVAADLVPSSSLQPPPQPLSVPSSRLPSQLPESRLRTDAEVKDPVAVRKIQKADREKLRRDRLNEHFLELGNTLDPDRPKNDKATILTDTIQMLKDLTAEVNRLKADHEALSEESRELTQEKNELREEKASLKSDIENLNAQYQQRLRVMFPWATMDPSVVMGPPYSYPVPVPVPPGPIPMHPSLQPFTFFGNQNPGAIPNPCSTFVPYTAAPNHPIEQPSAQYASNSHISSKQDSRSKSSDQHRRNNAERCDESNDVATDLELKMPGSSTQQDASSGSKKGKQSQRKEKSVTDCSSSSRFSSSQVLQDSSSNSVGDVPKPNN
ncbi:transcription factor bHLH121 [Momordica charantia]|uniref:Transcription factor bHLH121 n=1 Tax=Momordica charantia TaxID=3673 RepID=A0A6J1BSQ0_MOMCH|nr:transcription factor bHLH121 [Momordica charantia]